MPYKYLYLDVREDFTFELLYKDDHPTKRFPLIKTEISGINDILSKYKDQDPNPKLKLALSFTPFGTFNVTSVKVVLQLPPEKPKKSKGTINYLLIFLKHLKTLKPHNRRQLIHHQPNHLTILKLQILERKKQKN